VLAEKKKVETLHVSRKNDEEAKNKEKEE